MTGLEYVQYLTEKSIEYVNMTKSEKSQYKESKYNTPVYRNQWFGIIPFMLKFLKKPS